MSNQLWNLIEEKLNEQGYMSGVDRSRSRVQVTAEIFTPTSLVLEIFQYLDLRLFDPGRTILDPACGDGQFLLAAKWVKILHHGMSEENALKDIYGVDLMRDNVDLCRKRLGGGLLLMGDSLNPTARLEGQTDFEHREMVRLFYSHSEPRRGALRGRSVDEATLF